MGGARRRGIATGEAVLIAASLCTIGALGVVIAPGLLRAGPDKAPLRIDEPDDPAKLAVFTALRAMFDESRSVIRLWDPDSTGRCAVLLWYSDEEPLGTIDEPEVVLIQHSPVMETITASVVEPGDAGAGPLDVSRVLDERFADLWARRDDVGTHVVAGGVRAMRIERVGEESGVMRLRVRLTWSGRVADERISEAGFECELPRLQGLE